VYLANLYLKTLYDKEKAAMRRLLHILILIQPDSTDN